MNWIGLVMVVMVMTVTMSVAVSMTMTVSMSVTMSMTPSSLTFWFWLWVGIASLSAVMMMIPATRIEWDFNVDVVIAHVFAMFDLVAEVQGVSLVGGPAFGYHDVKRGVGGNGVAVVGLAQLQIVNIWAAAEGWHVPGGRLDEAVEGVSPGYVDAVRLAQWDTSLNLLE